MLGQIYRHAPVSSMYLFGRKQDIGFEINIEGRLWHRHHVRFWATTLDMDMPLEPNSIHWFPRRARKQARLNEEVLWLGAASKDVGLALIKIVVELRLASCEQQGDKQHQRPLYPAWQ